MLPDPALHGVYLGYLTGKEDELREAAARAWPDQESRRSAPHRTRLAGRDKDRTRWPWRSPGVLRKHDNTEFLSPALRDQPAQLRRLSSHRPRISHRAGHTRPCAHPLPVPEPGLASKDEKTGLAQILAAAGDRDSIPTSTSSPKTPTTT